MFTMYTCVVDTYKSEYFDAATADIQMSVFFVIFKHSVSQPAPLLLSFKVSNLFHLFILFNSIFMQGHPMALVTGSVQNEDPQSGPPAGPPFGPPSGPPFYSNNIIF